MTPCYARILLLVMFASGLVLIGSVTAFLINQTTIGIICLIVGMVLSLSFLEYACVRHHFVLRSPVPPPSPSIEIVTAQV
jgi:hypothetical protein